MTIIPQEPAQVTRERISQYMQFLRLQDQAMQRKLSSRTGSSAHSTLHDYLKKEHGNQEINQTIQSIFNSESKKIPCASPEAVTKLKACRRLNVSSNEFTDVECAICSESLCHEHSQKRLLRLPCGHVYHSTCVGPWLLTQQCTCPECRYEVGTSDYIYETGRKIRMRGKKKTFGCSCGKGNKAQEHTAQCLLQN